MHTHTNTHTSKRKKARKKERKKLLSVLQIAGTRAWLCQIKSKSGLNKRKPFSKGLLPEGEGPL